MTDALDGALETMWLQACNDANAEEAFLHELSQQRVLVILRQPPGPNDAAPWRNLVSWQRGTDSVAFTPLFTGTEHASFALPPPALFVRVPMRVLLAAGDSHRFILNPLSEQPFELQEKRLALLRRFIAKAHHDAEWPSLKAPWAFRLPEDALFPVAVKLVEWFSHSGRVDQAFLYELTRGQKPRTEIVLGLNEPADEALADELIAIAIKAGVDPNSFIVRFLPDEPSHREGIALAGLTPFYQRQGSLLH